MRFILYSDFNCPFCYAMGERLISLGYEDCCDWKGVQHAPQLPVPMDKVNSMLQLELAKEVKLVNQLAPELEIKKPMGKPNTFNSFLAVSSLSDSSAEKAQKLKNHLYKAFWVDGIDISDPNYLVSWANGEGVDLNLSSPTAINRCKAWQNEWQTLGVGSVPLIIDTKTGFMMSGLAATNQIKDFFNSKKQNKGDD